MADRSLTESQRFPKERRLRRRGEFQHVFDLAARASGRYLTVLVAPSSSDRPRLGIVASRKLGDAVRRNRAKRLIREVFRRTTSLAGAPAVDIVVIPRRELFAAAYASLETDFRGALRRSTARLPRS